MSVFGTWTQSSVSRALLCKDLDIEPCFLLSFQLDILGVIKKEAVDASPDLPRSFAFSWEAKGVR